MASAASPPPRQRIAALLAARAGAMAAVVDLPRAGILRRLAAHLLDAIAVAILSGLATGLLLAFTRGAPRQGAIAFLTGSTAIGILYAGWRLSGPARATFGKRVMGLQVLRTDGRPVSFLQGAGHAAGFALSLALILPIAILVPLLRRDRRGLHEIVAGTATTRRGAAMVAPLPAPTAAADTGGVWNRGGPFAAPAPPPAAEAARRSERPVRLTKTPPETPKTAVVERRKRW